MMMKHQVIIAVLLCLHAVMPYNVYAQNHANAQATDTTIQIQADFSGCGASDSVFYRVTIDRFGNPLVWTLTAKDCKGVVRFYHSACACESDEYFESEEYIVRRSYQGSKRDWFTIDLPGRIITKRMFPPQSGIFDRNNDGSIYHVAKDYLVDRCQVPS